MTRRDEARLVCVDDSLHPVTKRQLLQDVGDVRLRRRLADYETIADFGVGSPRARRSRTSPSRGVRSATAAGGSGGVAGRCRANSSITERVTAGGACAGLASLRERLVLPSASLSRSLTAPSAGMTQSFHTGATSRRSGARCASVGLPPHGNGVLTGDALALRGRAVVASDAQGVEDDDVQRQRRQYQWVLRSEDSTGASTRSHALH